MAVIKGEALDIHVASAVAFLSKLKASNRPATEQKLLSELTRKGCCRIRHYVPPGCLAKAMAVSLQSCGASVGLLSLVEALASDSNSCGSTWNIKSEAINEVAINEEQKFVDISAKAAATLLMNCPESSFLGQPIDVLASWICKHCGLQILTNAKSLLEALTHRCLVITDPDGPAKYDEASLKSFRGPSSKPREMPSVMAWLSKLGHLEKFQKQLPVESNIKAFFLLPCSQALVSSKELPELKSKLCCGLQWNRKEGYIKVFKTKETVIEQDVLRDILSLVFGDPGVFICKGCYTGDTCRHIIGKGGKQIKMIMAAHRIKLSLRSDNVHGSRIIGWLSTDRIPHCPDSDRAREALKSLQESIAGISDSVSHDIMTKLEVISEVTASKAHGSRRPQLARTFSREYTQMKSDREARRETALLRRQQKKEHLESKEERLHTKRGRKKDKDKGPAMHGGRHKGNDLQADD